MQKLPRQTVLSGHAFTQGRLPLVHCSLLSLPSERELLSGVKVCLRSVFTPSTNRFALGPAQLASLRISIDHRKILRLRLEFFGSHLSLSKRWRLALVHLSFFSLSSERKVLNGVKISLCSITILPPLRRSPSLYTRVAGVAPRSHFTD